MRRLVLLAGCMMASCAALAENTYTWTGEAGVEGLWSVPANWSSKTSIPPEGHHWCFKDGAVVSIDGDHHAGRCYITGSVKFVGNSTARASHDYFTGDVVVTVGDHATFGVYNPSKTGDGSSGAADSRYSFIVEDEGTLIFKNPENHLTNLCVRGGTYWHFGSSGTTLNEGAISVLGGFYTNNYALTVKPGAQFVQSGGKVHQKTLTVSGGRLELSGGTCNIGTLTVNGGELDISGGTRTIGTLSLTDVDLALTDTWIPIALSETMSVRTLSVEGDGGFEVNVPAGQAAGRYLVVKGSIGQNFANIPVRLTGACEGWKVLHVAHYIFVTSGVALTSEEDFQWTGAVDDKWSTDGNWKVGLAPTNRANVFLGSEEHPAITNDVVGGSYYRIRHIGGTGKASSLPVVVRGETITLTSEGVRSETTSAVYTRSYYPIIFECPVISSGSKFGPMVYSSDGLDSDAIIFAGGFTAKMLNMAGGPICFGGVSTCTSVTYGSDKSSNSRGHLKVLSGGEMTVTAQDAAISHACTVMAGGHLTIQGTAFAWSDTTYVHKIDGTLDVEAPYGGSVNQVYSGSGRVNIGAWKAATASYAFRLSDAVCLYPCSWSTVCAGDIVRTVCATNGSPTLGATCDWTYGPDLATYPGATSAAADRAAVIATNATLIVDTEDPDTQAAHTITFADPFGGPGTLAKTGVGTLVLQTAATADETSLVLSEGVLELGAAQTFRTVTFEGGSLAFSGALAAAIEDAAGQWVEVLSAETLVGAPTAVGAYKLKVETDEETGAVRLFAKGVAGMMILFK